MCKCGNTFFAKVAVNEFHDRTTDLYQSLPEVEIDLDIKMYKCIRCGEYKLSNIDYYGASTDDKKLYQTILDLIEGKDVVPERHNNYGPIQPGTMRPLKTRKGDPINDGKFVRKDSL